MDVSLNIFESGNGLNLLWVDSKAVIFKNHGFCTSGESPLKQLVRPTFCMLEMYVCTRGLI